ncbi:MAG: hypothetical protein MSJ26_03320 [Oscillospiraceae bacterium]|nr:hypothetical protein [Oscillospiraceae bacterium]
MESTDKNSLLLRYKKHFRRKQLLWNALSITYTLFLIPLIKFLDGTDYSTLWKIISIAMGISLFAMNIIQSRSMKRQLEAISENTAEKISAELEECARFRVFAFTSEYLFSKEGLILPYYEIQEAITNTYVGSPSATNIVFKTKSFGKLRIPVGLGYMSESFYDMLSAKCPNAEILFRVNYQKADMEEYFNTVRAESITVVRKK